MRTSNPSHEPWAAFLTFPRNVNRMHGLNPRPPQQALGLESTADARRSFVCLNQARTVLGLDLHRWWELDEKVVDIELWKTLWGQND